MTHVSRQQPPDHIYKPAVEKWGVDFKKGIVFTYGDVIHSAVEIPKDLMVHELTHVRQQREFDGGKDAWWEKYLADPKFRTAQELEAYRAQWQWIKNNVKDRNEQVRILSHCAQSLGGKMYGNVMTVQEAMEAIKQ